MLRLSESPFVLLTAALCLPACTDDKGGGDGETDPSDDTAGSDGGGDGTTDSPCPEEVPEQYQYLWDCSASTCDGGVFAVHAGTGSTSEAGLLTASEQWFLFWSEDEYCIEEFEIGGPTSPYEPASFNCSGCVEIYEAEWEMNTDNACSLLWGAVFIDDYDNAEGPFSGYLMFDTHNAFGSRNEDNKMLVVSALVSGSSYHPNADYGRGTAIPTTDNDGPPQDYEWVSNGACWNISRDLPTPGPGFEPPVATPLSAN